ncbi:hypothetical protein CUC15_03440 [Oceanobacillus zhaokaii]|uniref:Uncharacterized protein n=1 Tax=Oceanobacillus zhaokaii TaxID=2052660 RepID=A0A345PDJ4_9BACI|nr:hypothetical protein [Oceanobacillus zhaokaii]AXI08074.1 hypothetical protein CUC15_03440 [Oceanobacillus zhaokaii]
MEKTDKEETDVEENETFKKIEAHIQEIEQYGVRYRSLYTQIAYWRKTNQIHRWFVEFVQDG